MFVMLDRDGVINVDSDEFIKTEEEWIPIPGSIDSIVKLTAKGYRVVIITNQSGVGRGLFTANTLSKIHKKMLAMVNSAGGAIEKIYICPHRPEENCACRKPKTGLIDLFCQDFDVDIQNTYFVGDTIKDIKAALSSGAIPILVKTGKGSKTIQNYSGINIPIFNDLYHATDFILSKK